MAKLMTWLNLSKGTLWLPEILFVFHFSEDFARIAARRFARKLQKLGNKVKFSNYRVVNVLGTCSLPFSINIVDFSKNRKEAR